MAIPRGIRNNNPGNIRKGKTTWLGEVSGADKEFCTFETALYGLRALAKLLLNYSERYRLNTCRGIISRFAPASENNTKAYVKAVAGHLGLEPDEPFEVKKKLLPLMQAIIAHENGASYAGHYSQGELEKAIAMAGG